MNRCEARESAAIDEAIADFFHREFVAEVAGPTTHDDVRIWSFDADDGRRLFAWSCSCGAGSDPEHVDLIPCVTEAARLVSAHLAADVT